jgi:hypothetical protein
MAVDHSARNRFFNSPAAMIGITPISTRHTCHATPVVVIVSSSITISIAVSISIAISIVTITTRMWISLVVIQRIPANVIAKREVERERDQRRAPPTAVPIEQASWTPGPVTVVVNPASVVIRRPTPWLVTDPCPTIRRNPGPLPVTIRRPIAVNADRTRERTPDPTVIVSLDPVAVSTEIFAAPNIFVVVLDVILQSLREVLLALNNPIVNRVAWRSSHQIPITSSFA